MGVALVANYFWYDARASESTKNQQRLLATQTQIAVLDQRIGEVNTLNKRKKEVEDKLKVLVDLRKSRSGPVRMLDALATATPKKVWIKEFDEKANAVSVKGSAVSHDDVAEFMRGLGTVVWTPRGMGRVVEQKRDAKNWRVELLNSEGTIEDFPVADVSPFFKGIDLKQASQAVSSTTPGAASAARVVDFEITLTANYAI